MKAFEAVYAGAADGAPFDPTAMTLATADGRRASRRARRAAPWARRARLRLLHQLREPQGTRDRRQPAGGAVLLLAVDRPAGARRGTAGAARRRGIGRVFRDAAARQAGRRLGVGAEPAARVARGARRRVHGDRRALRRTRRAAPALLGRLPPHARSHRVLEGRRVPAARPLPVHEKRRRLDAASGSRRSTVQRGTGAQPGAKEQDAATSRVSATRHSSLRHS